MGLRKEIGLSIAVFPWLPGPYGDPDRLFLVLQNRPSRDLQTVCLLGTSPWGIRSELDRTGIHEPGRASPAIGPWTRVPRRAKGNRPDAGSAFVTSTGHSSAWSIQASLPHGMTGNAPVPLHASRLTVPGCASHGSMGESIIHPKRMSVQGFTTQELL